MNTLKKCILLGILILNLIPYMQDGKVKLTTTEAGAQYYTIENTGLGIWICGKTANPTITIISTKECDLVRDENVSNDEDCFCGTCQSLKTFCNEICPYCLGTSTLDENGNEYFTVSDDCYCLCGSLMSGCGENAYCLNTNCPYSQQTGTTEQPVTIYDDNIFSCITENYDYGMSDIHPLPQSGNYHLGHKNWCSIMVLATILGDSEHNVETDGNPYTNYNPLYLANLYSYYSLRDLTDTILGVLSVDQKPFYALFGVTISSTLIAHKACEMYEAVKGGTNSGIVVAQSSADTQQASGHTLLFYRFNREYAEGFEITKNNWVYTYNTAMPGWDGVIKLCDAEKYPGLFNLIYK